MTKMHSLKLSKADREKSMEGAASASSAAPSYPWGASLSLDHEALEKLEITTLPAVGDVLILMAKVKVTSVSAQDSEHGKSRAVSLQITDACLEPEDAKRSAVEALYESKE